MSDWDILLLHKGQTPHEHTLVYTLLRQELGIQSKRTRQEIVFGAPARCGLSMHKRRAKAIAEMLEAAGAVVEVVPTRRDELGWRKWLAGHTESVHLARWLLGQVEPEQYQHSDDMQATVEALTTALLEAAAQDIKARQEEPRPLTATLLATLRDVLCDPIGGRWWACEQGCCKQMGDGPCLPADEDGIVWCPDCEDTEARCCLSRAGANMYADGMRDAVSVVHDAPNNFEAWCMMRDGLQHNSASIGYLWMAEEDT